MTKSEDGELRDAFQLLANETRLEILYALWNAPDWTATFTELKDAVGMRDSGGFQYHLNALDGTFIEKTDEGYTHLAGSIALYRGMLGSITGPDEVEPISLDEPCPNCDSRLELRYEHQVFDVRCPTCDESVSNAPFLPAGLDGRPDDDRVRAFDRWTKRLISLLRDGVCPWCASTVTHDIGTGSGEIRITHTCDRCGGFLRTTVVENIIDHPAVISFCYDHDVDVTGIPHWKLDEVVSVETHVVADNPPKVEATIRHSGDELTVALDAEMRVTVVGNRN